MIRFALALPAFAVCFLSFHLVMGQVINGDFQSGNTGFTTDFTYSPGSINPAKTYAVVANPRNVHGSAASYFDHTTGDATGLMMAVNGSTTPNDVVWSQSISVLPNTSYDFGMWTSSWFGPAGLSVRVNGSAIAADFSTPSTNGLWAEFNASWNSSASTLAEIEIVNVTSQYGGNDFALDDISFVSTVPEPTSMVLVGLAILGLVGNLRSRL